MAVRPVSASPGTWVPPLMEMSEIVRFPVVLRRKAATQGCHARLPNVSRLPNVGSLENVV
jgi:hypothetical protein